MAIEKWSKRMLQRALHGPVIRRLRQRRELVRKDLQISVRGKSVKKADVLSS